MDQLSDDERDKVKQFQEITNVEDADVAVATLASVEWDVMRAMEAHFSVDVDGPAHVVHAPAEGLQRRPSIEVVDGPDEDERRLLERSLNARIAARVARPQTAPIGGVPFREIDDMDIQPTSSRINGRAGRNGLPHPLPVVAHPPARVVQIDDEEDDMDIDDYSFDTSRGREDDDDIVRDAADRDYQVPLVPTECDDVREALHNFVTVFEARFRDSARAQLPSFFVGALPDAIKEAFDPSHRGPEERRPLAIYLHHDKSIAANIFPSKVLCSDAVSNLLRHQFVLWPWDVTHKENESKLLEWMSLCNMEDVRQMFEIRARNKDLFPMLVLLAKERGSIQIAEFCVGTETPDSVVTKLMSAVDSFNTIRLTDMADEAARKERERIREEQAIEYEASLAADRARAEAKEREIREQKEAEEKRVREEQEELMKRQLLESNLPDEPSASDTGVLHVKFRMPGGEHMMRRFRSKEKVQVLLNFLTSKGYSPDKYKFFNSDFPKKEVGVDHACNSFADMKWPAREQIFVEEM